MQLSSGDALESANDNTSPTYVTYCRSRPRPLTYSVGQCGVVAPIVSNSLITDCNLFDRGLIIAISPMYGLSELPSLRVLNIVRYDEHASKEDGVLSQTRMSVTHVLTLHALNFAPCKFQPALDYFCQLCHSISSNFNHNLESLSKI